METNRIDKLNKRAQAIIRRNKEKAKKAKTQDEKEDEHPYSGPYYGYSDYAEDAGIYGYDLD